MSDLILRKCRSCGGLIQTHYNQETVNKLIATGFCFMCDFWEEIYNDVTYARANPHLQDIAITNEFDVYYIFVINLKDPRFTMGFGGKSFVFELTNGKVLESNDVWCRGKIPVDMRHRFTPNVVSMVEKTSVEFDIFDAL